MPASNGRLQSINHFLNGKMKIRYALIIVKIYNLNPNFNLYDQHSIFYSDFRLSYLLLKF